MATHPAPVTLDPTRVEDLTAGQVLSAVAASRARERAEAAHQLLLACAWADQHPALDPGDAATFCERTPDGSTHLPIAGEGCPEIHEYAAAEFGAVLGESTTAAKRLIGHALELRHRLPRLWEQVLAGQVPAWRARLVAEQTISCGLTRDAAAWVDGQVAAVTGRVGTAQVLRLVDEAIARYDLEQRPTVEPGRRRVDLVGEHSASGTLTLEAVLSTADAVDLDHALAHEAATLKALGSDADLDTRRSQALGHLARQQTALALFRDEHPEAGEPTDEVRLPAARELVLTLHFDATEAAGGGLEIDPLGRLDKGQRLVFLEHVQAWCAESHTRVSIRPVIDLNDELSSPHYAIPDRIRDHVVMRDRTCMFPHCTRAAQRCDLDHVVPYDSDGPTSTSNLTPLCRRHHRLKTHTGWRVEMPTPGTLIWTSPHGHRFRRDRFGTTQDPPDEPVVSRLAPLAPQPPNTSAPTASPFAG